jgi:hypothetical protein
VKEVKEVTKLYIRIQNIIMSIDNK